jgi:hypothetical protein
MTGLTKENACRDMKDFVSTMRTRTVLFDGGGGLRPLSPVLLAMMRDVGELKEFLASSYPGTEDLKDLSAGS